MKTLAEKTAEEIETKIIDGDFSEGETLPQRKIAELCDVSQIVARESLRILENEGIVEHEPKWGSRVIEFDGERLEEQYLLREALEGITARVVAQKMTERDRDELYERAEELDNLFSDPSSDPKKLASKHCDFHNAIAQISGYDRLIQTMERLNIQQLIFFTSRVVAIKNLQQPSQWHRDLVETLWTGEADAAEEFMREHIRKGLEDLQSANTHSTS
jgi:DNA-binding GntR family transcriptional regulator